MYARRLSEVPFFGNGNRNEDGERNAVKQGETETGRRKSERKDENGERAASEAATTTRIETTTGNRDDLGKRDDVGKRDHDGDESEKEA